MNRRLRHSLTPRNLTHRRPTFHFLQDLDDLLFAVTLLFHDRILLISFSDSLIQSGLVFGGQVTCSYSSPNLIRCTITNNSAERSGGAVSFYECDHPTLTHCTVAGNTAGYNGGALYCNSSNPSLTNCILWNLGCEIADNSSSSPTATYCCVQGGYTGSGNIN
ncbi:MAG: hypothetical protein KC978_14435, partial [Candidatus Omnitrophica bacterium]|nr:hypothetical protein [Candidatus Omnitrophota bacterium]